MSGPHTESGQERVELAPSLTWSAVFGFPAASALLLGLTYGVGAYSRLQELKHAGVPVSVAFPLIPISQHLGRGLQVILDPVVLLIVALVIGGVAMLEAGVPRRVGETPSTWVRALDFLPRKIAELPTLARVGMNSVLVVVLLFVAPLLLAGAVLVLAVLMLIIASAAPRGARLDVVRGRRRFELRGVIVSLAIMLAVATFALFQEAVDAAPLPKVTLQVVAKASATGSLVTLADGQWYLWNPHTGISAVDARSVSSAVITVPRRRSRLLLSLLRLEDSDGDRTPAKRIKPATS